MNTTASQRKTTYSDVLRNRNFALLWTGQSVSLVGDIVYLLAINWLILERTGSALQIGGNVILTVISGAMFSSIAGVIADRWNRRRIMILSDLIRGGILLALLLFINNGVFNIWFVYSVTLVLTAVSAFFAPAYQSLIPNLLQKDELVMGRSLNVSSSSLIKATGTAFGGLLIAFMGTQVAIFVNAISFFFSATMLTFIRISQSPPYGRESKLTLTTIFLDAKLGWGYIRSIPVLVSLFALFTIADFGAGFTWPVHAIFAEKVLRGGSALYGYLSAVSLLGGFAGGYYIGRYSTWFNQYPGRSFALAAFIWGCLSIFYSQSTSVPLALGLRFAIGWSLSMIHVPISALVDVSVSDEFRGRVWAMIGVGSLIAGALATYLSGLLADQTTPRLSYLIAGIILVLAACLAMCFSTIRHAQINKQG